MLEVELGIRHHGCPVSDTSSNYPHIQVQNISKVEADGEVSKRLLGLRGDGDNISSFAEDFRCRDRVETFNRVSEDENLTYFIAHINFHENPSIASLVKSVGCFQHSTVTVQGGIENWVIYTDNRNLVHELISDIESFENEVTLYRTVDVGEISGLKMSGIASLSNLLTPAQKETFDQALRSGYYNDDSDVTIEDISEPIDRHHTTVWEHLDKAENKILRDVGKKISKSSSEGA